VSQPVRAGGPPARRASPVTVLVGAVSAMWVVEGADQLVLDGDLDRFGIVPRQIDGLSGIVLAPFLHAGFGHLLANTIPLLVLGGLIAFKGVRRLVAVSVGVVLIGGLGVWLFGRTAIHLGASGVVFGFLGYLVAAGVLERRLRSVILAVAAVALYGGLVWGALPGTPGVSWESHLFGLLAGIVMARIVTRPAASPPRP
jgi:membrane associated rhomboid family serine protease